MKLNNRFIFGILSLLLAAVIAFVALPTIARQTNGKEEIVRITQPVLKGEQISSENAEVVEVGGYNLPSNIAHQLSDVNGLYATADLAVGDYILTSKISSVPVSSDVALNSIPSGKVAISLTVKTLAQCILCTPGAPARPLQSSPTWIFRPFSKADSKPDPQPVPAAPSLRK